MAPSVGPSLALLADAALRYLRRPRGERAWAVLVFRKLAPGALDYSIRMNYTTVPTTRRVVESFYRGIKPVQIPQSSFSD